MLARTPMQLPNNMTLFVQASWELFNCSITVRLKTRMYTNKERQTYSDKYIRTNISGNSNDKYPDVVSSSMITRTCWLISLFISQRNDKIHQMTSQEPHIIRVDISDFNNAKRLSMITHTSRLAVVVCNEQNKDIKNLRYWLMRSLTLLSMITHTSRLAVVVKTAMNKTRI